VLKGEKAQRSQPWRALLKRAKKNRAVAGRKSLQEVKRLRKDKQENWKSPVARVK
jgi:hypothetical protein